VEHRTTRDSTGVIDRIARIGLVPVVELAEGVDAVALADALAAGGLATIEITLRTAGALGAIRAIRTSRPEMVVAAGTVMSSEAVDAAVDAGAQLIVAPGFASAVVERAVERGVPILPGAVTPTEIELGLAHGLATFKFFPAEAAGGVRYLAALAGPYRDVRFVPTGGIDPSNLGAYAALPNVVACGGSWMVAKGLLRERDMASVSRLAREGVETVREARTRAEGA
jgi:2-dehydro-3-deoxyphosphogluconate aldolase/(4S)-4-hydroxy-2-oxoglutarate aldolase